MVLQDVLSVRNVYEDAQKAKHKKAALGTNITIENFSSEEVIAIDEIDELGDLSKKDQNTLLSVGVDSDESERAGSFLQMDQSNVFTSELSKDIELMNTGAVLEKYSWLEDYIWNAIKPDADKYIAEAVLKEKEDGAYSGYFVRSKPGTKEFFPVQACMFIADTDIMQIAHNIIIDEENTEFHLNTGCATGDDISSAIHEVKVKFILNQVLKLPLLWLIIGLNR